MNKQISLSYVNYELVQTITKKKIFLTKIEEIIPFGNWKTPNQGHTTTIQRRVQQQAIRVGSDVASAYSAKSL